MIPQGLDGGVATTSRSAPIRRAGAVAPCGELSRASRRHNRSRLRRFAPGLSVRLLAQTDSTNRLARADKEAVFAEHQTAGRGRRGARWISRPGASILFSLCRICGLSPQSLAGLSMAVGVALRETLARDFSLPLRLKWPNDLLDSRRRKIGGVLIEAAPVAPIASVGDAKSASRVVVGVGVNLFTTAQMRREIDRPAAGLFAAASLARDPSLRDRIAAALALAVNRAIDDFVAATANGPGFAAFAAAARAAHFVAVGDFLSCEIGGENRRGVFAGFGARGELLLARDGGIETVRVGAVVA